MGYTHYWNFKQPPVKLNSLVEKRYQLAIRQCNKIIRAYSKINGGLSGYNAHTIGDKYKGIKLNGKGDLMHEDFIMRETFLDNFHNYSLDDWRHERYNGFNFCKTARKPYDTVVVACLIVLQHYLKDWIKVSSDGDELDWELGLRLAKRVLKLKRLSIPELIDSFNQKFERIAIYGDR